MNEKYRPQRNTVFLALAVLTLYFALGAAVQPSRAQTSSGYSPQSLLLTVYADGKVDVEYVISVDPLLASVEVHLPGKFYESMLVVDENGLPLDYSIVENENKVIVYTLGAKEATLYYTTSDLTNKAGGIWTLNVVSPISFVTRLPPDATVVALSDAPISIWVGENYYFIQMPPGAQEISYTLGAAGSRDRALTLISEAQQLVEKARAAGAEVSQAEAKLEKAKIALDGGNYGEAELLASEAKQLADQALASLPGGAAPTPTTPAFPWWLVGAGVAVLIAASFVFLKLRKGKGTTTAYERKFRQIDVRKILEKKGHLSPEDREAVEFIASAGGEVFEAELREKFRLPKSTAWRMAKRLKKEGIVEIERVGGQNLIRLIESS